MTMLDAYLIGLATGLVAACGVIIIVKLCEGTNWRDNRRADLRRRTRIREKHELRMTKARNRAELKAVMARGY